ncbi:hypothetical protein [Bacillus solimangrovi]|nr:hypothetical protein [Bacillus solimangrovi]
MFLLFAIFGYINSLIVKLIIGTTSTNNFVSLSQLTGILIFIIIIYRNKLQFNGFFQSGTEKALSPKITKYMIAIGLLLIAVPYFFLILGMGQQTL